MSTIVVVRKGDVAALAADSMTKWGAQKESAAYVVNHQKILQVGESYIAYCGMTAAYHMLEDYFARLKTPPKLTSVSEIFAAWLKLHTALKEQYFINPMEDASDAVESSRFDVLICNPAGIFGVGTHRSVQEFSKFYASGSGNEYALGALWALYDQPELDATVLAQRSVAAAAEFSDGTGLPSTVITVPLRGGH